MSFGIPVRNGLGVGLISYATLLVRRAGGGVRVSKFDSTLATFDTTTITFDRTA